MESQIVIRPFSAIGAGDKTAVKRLVTEATMSTVYRFTVMAFRRDAVSQSALILAASIFILIGLPLHYCLMALPGIAGLVYFAVWVSHRAKAWATHGDLDDIESEYQGSDLIDSFVTQNIPKHA